MTDAEQPRIRPIALPVEHGSWGLVVEPIVLGLLVAPSLAGACLGLGAFAGFLIRRPLKVFLAERRHEESARRSIARTFIVAYALAAAAGLGVAAGMKGIGPLVPLLLAAPTAAVFLIYDLKNQSRSWQAELSGAATFALVAPAVAMAADWPAAPALALAAALALRAAPSILYVRDRIRRERGRPHNRNLTLALHAASLAAIVALCASGLLPWLVVLPFVALLVRAAIGLSGPPRGVTMKAIGWNEMAYGSVTVLAIVAGHWSTRP